jgi:hypothetical protein
VTAETPRQGDNPQEESVARITIHDDEMFRSRLPLVCVRCGEPAKRWIRVEYRGLPLWMLLFAPVALVLLAISARVKRFELPVCDRHVDFRVETDRVGSLFFGVLTFGSIVAIFLWIVTARLEPPYDLVARFITMAWVVFAVGLFLMLVVTMYRALRPAWISPRSITLANVSPIFVEGIREKRIECLAPDYDETKPAEAKPSDGMPEDRIRR